MRIKVPGPPPPIILVKIYEFSTYVNMIEIDLFQQYCNQHTILVTNFCMYVSSFVGIFNSKNTERIICPYTVNTYIRTYVSINSFEWQIWWNSWKYFFQKINSNGLSKNRKYDFCKIIKIITHSRIVIRVDLYLECKILWYKLS